MSCQECHWISGHERSCQWWEDPELDRLRAERDTLADSVSEINRALESVEAERDAALAEVKMWKLVAETDNHVNCRERDQLCAAALSGALAALRKVQVHVQHRRLHYWSTLSMKEEVMDDECYDDCPACVLDTVLMKEETC